MRRMLLAFLIAALAACEGGTDETPGDVLGGGDNAAGDTAASGACGVPAGARVLADYQNYDVDPNDPTQSSVVRGLVVDGATLYVALLDSVVTLPAGGGTPTRIYEAQDLLGLRLFGLAGGGILIRDGAAAVDASGAAVAYPAPVHPINGINGPSAELVAPTGERIVRFDDVDGSLAPTVSHYVILRAGAAAQEVLVQNVDVGWGRGMVFGAGALWTNANRIGSGAAPDADQPVRIGLDGAVSTLSVDKPGPLILVTDHFIYFNRSDGAVVGEAGVWRVPLAGGSAERLGGVIGGFEGATDGQGHVALGDGTSLYAIADLPGATLTKIVDLPVRASLPDSCGPHGLAMGGGRIVLSMFDGGRDQALLFDYPVP